MTLTFPLGVDQFIDLLPVKSITLTCPDASEMSRTAGGDLLREDLGARLWQGDVTLGRLTPAEAGEAMAMIEVLSGAGRSFFIYDTRAPGPRMDPDGSLLGSSTVQIRAVISDNRQLQLKGLPPGYVLKRGDRVAFSYGSNPVRYALHRIVEAESVATALGNTFAFEVTPNVRPGIAVDDPVTLIKPACKAIIVPGSIEPGTSGRYTTEGIKFGIIQTLR